MATLRMTIIRPVSGETNFPVEPGSILCDEVMGVQLSGPLDSLIEQVQRLAQKGPAADAISLDVTLDLRPLAGELPSGSLEFAPAVAAVRKAASLLQRA